MTPIEAMARGIAKEARVPEDIGYRVYLGHARAALDALADNVSEGMVEAGGKAAWLRYAGADAVGFRDCATPAFIAMLKAARDEG